MDTTNTQTTTETPKRKIDTLNIDYLKRAISKDDTRFNLQGIYRGKDRAYATDGHRLHYAELDSIETPFWLLNPMSCGIDSFPDCSRVFPNVDPLLTVMTHATKKDILKNLKNVLTIAKDYSKHTPLALFTFSAEKIVIQSYDTDISWEYTINCNNTVNVISEITIPLNLQYFIDGLYEGHNVIEIYPHTHPIIIKTEAGNAVIMPCKLPEPKK